MVIDTHVHVIAGAPAVYPTRPEPPAWPTVTGERLIAAMDAAGVARAVLVQSFFTYGFDNSYVLDCAARWPGRFGVVAVIDQTAEDAPEVLAELVVDHGVGGVRLMPKDMPAGVLWAPATFGVWECAAELGIPVTVAAELGHISELRPVLERFAHVTVCLEHMWGIEIDRPPFAALAPVLATAELPNVHLKLAPNNSHAARDAGVTPHAFYERLVEAFGVDRLMWGSNYPAHPTRFGEYRDRLEIMRSDLDFLSDVDRDAFFGDTAAHLWPDRTAGVP